LVSGRLRASAPRLLHLELGVVEAAGSRRAHLDDEESGVAGRQERGATELGLQRDAPLTKLATAISAIQRRWCSAQAITLP
jgi:hypothetical protein